MSTQEKIENSLLYFPLFSAYEVLIIFFCSDFISVLNATVVVFLISKKVFGIVYLSGNTDDSIRFPFISFHSYYLTISSFIRQGSVVLSEILTEKILVDEVTVISAN